MLKVRIAKLCDSESVFEWRNDKYTRQMSHDSRLLDWDEHSHWFKTVLKSADRYLLICTDETDKKVGIVHFKLFDNESEISINLAPTSRGKGLGSVCLARSIESFKAEFKDIARLQAEVKSENIPSWKSFEKVGFQLYRELNGVRTYHLAL